MRLLIKSIALFVAIVLVLLAAPLLFIERDGKSPEQLADGLPWQIEAQSGGLTRVFQLVPGGSSLADAWERIGPDFQIALIIAPGETGTVEAFHESFKAGIVTGKLILTMETTMAQREDMLKRAIKADFMESTTRRITLSEADQREMLKAKLSGITFIPAANLNEEIILQRFGVPAERIRSGETVEHFLYPDKGLDLRLDTKGKEVLQYVAPRDFARLRDPLRVAVK